MNSTPIQNFLGDNQDEEESILFAEWVQERCDELGITEDYFIMEFI